MRSRAAPAPSGRAGPRRPHVHVRHAVEHPAVDAAVDAPALVLGPRDELARARRAHDVAFERERGWGGGGGGDGKRGRRVGLSFIPNMYARRAPRVARAPPRAAPRAASRDTHACDGPPQLAPRGARTARSGRGSRWRAQRGAARPPTYSTSNAGSRPRSSAAAYLGGGARAREPARGGTKPGAGGGCQLPLPASARGGGGRGVREGYERGGARARARARAHGADTPPEVVDREAAVVLEHERARDARLARRDTARHTARRRARADVADRVLRLPRLSALKRRRRPTSAGPSARPSTAATRVSPREHGHARATRRAGRPPVEVDHVPARRREGLRFIPDGPDVERSRTPRRRPGRPSGGNPPPARPPPPRRARRAPRLGPRAARPRPRPRARRRA